MRLKLKKKWGIIPSEPIYGIGHHPIDRYKTRVEDNDSAVVKQQIYASVVGGTVLLERDDMRYIQSQDKGMIYPCIKKAPNNYVVKTTLLQEMGVSFGY